MGAYPRTAEVRESRLQAVQRDLRRGSVLCLRRLKAGLRPKTAPCQEKCCLGKNWFASGWGQDAIFRWSAASYWVTFPKRLGRFPIVDARRAKPFEKNGKQLNRIEESIIPGFRFVPRTGVIYVMHEATQHGFSYDDPRWANLGQGSPETGPMPGAPPRIETLTIPANTQQYGPVAGNGDLRQAVADFYNTTFRKGKKSQYTRDNVSIASGGRLALTRLASALGNVNMGHFIPDYTAYEELLSVFKAFTAIPILLDAEAATKSPWRH